MQQILFVSVYAVVRYAFGDGSVIWENDPNIWTKKYFKNLA